MNLTVIVMAFMLTFGGFVACNDPYENNVDYAKLEAGELELREMYYQQYVDSLMNLAVDSIDRRETEGWVAFIMDEGSDDAVQVGKRVSLRYTYSTIFKDDDNKAVAVPRYSNVDSDVLVEYTVGALTSTDVEVFDGVDRVIRYMNLYGKAHIILPHQLAEKDYFPYVAEIEVVAMQLD